jgi:hypothetical protein
MKNAFSFFERNGEGHKNAMAFCDPFPFCDAELKSSMYFEIDKTSAKHQGRCRI